MVTSLLAMDSPAITLAQVPEEPPVYDFAFEKKTIPLDPDSFFGANKPKVYVCQFQNVFSFKGLQKDETMLRFFKTCLTQNWTAFQ
jgi:hypothetical protein